MQFFSYPQVNKKKAHLACFLVLFAAAVGTPNDCCMGADKMNASTIMFSQAYASTINNKRLRPDDKSTSAPGGDSGCASKQPPSHKRMRPTFSGRITLNTHLSSIRPSAGAGVGTTTATKGEIGKLEKSVHFDRKHCVVSERGQFSKHYKKEKILGKGQYGEVSRVLFSYKVPTPRAGGSTTSSSSADDAMVYQSEFTEKRACTLNSLIIVTARN